MQTVQGLANHASLRVILIMITGWLGLVTAGCGRPSHDVVAAVPASSAGYISVRDLAVYYGADITIASSTTSPRQIHVSQTASSHVFTIDASPRCAGVLYLDNPQKPAGPSRPSCVSLVELAVNTGASRLVCELPSRVEGFLYSPNAERVAALVSSGMRFSLKVIDRKTGLVESIPLPDPAVYVLLCWSSDGSSVYCAKETAREVNVLRCRLPNQVQPVFSFRRNGPDGIVGWPAVVSASRALRVTRSGDAVLSDQRGGTVSRASLPNSRDLAVYANKVSGNGRYAALEYQSGSGQASVVFVDLTNMQVATELAKSAAGKESELRFLCWNPSSVRAAVASGSRTAPEVVEYNMSALAWR